MNKATAEIVRAVVINLIAILLVALLFRSHSDSSVVSTDADGNYI